MRWCQYTTDVQGETHNIIQAYQNDLFPPIQSLLKDDIDKSSITTDHYDTAHFVVKQLIKVNQNSSYPIKIFTLNRREGIEKKKIKRRLVFVHVFINRVHFFCST